MVWKLIVGFKVIVSIALVASLSDMGAGQVCQENLHCLNYGLPTFDECKIKRHPNGSMIQTIQKLIPYGSIPTRSCGATLKKNNSSSPQGYLYCRFPDCEDDSCKGGHCMETLTGFTCNYSIASPVYKHNQNALQPPRDCFDIQKSGLNTKGVYTIYPEGPGGPVLVYCDMNTDGGGWTVFQRREDGSIDFFLDWSAYKYGFGDISSEHWLGNDNIHRLTSQKSYELRVDLEDFEGESRFATYNSFRITNETEQYTLLLGNYSGNSGDSMSFHRGHMFSTKDRDNDGSHLSWEHCAERYKGAWWYSSCLESNLNGFYLHGNNTQHAKSVVWFSWRGLDYSLKKTQMKVRPKQAIWD